MRRLLVTIAVVGVAVGVVIAVGPLGEAVGHALHGDVHSLHAELRGLGVAGAGVLVGLILTHAVVFFPAEIPRLRGGRGARPALALRMDVRPRQPPDDRGRHLRRPRARRPVRIRSARVDRARRGRRPGRVDAAARTPRPPRAKVNTLRYTRNRMGSQGLAMSDRFTRDERGPTERDADARLARRARQQMLAAVSTLRAGFTGDVLARPDAAPAGDPHADRRRFQRLQHHGTE
jgi:hypothetical protein